MLTETCNCDSCRNIWWGKVSNLMNLRFRDKSLTFMLCLWLLVPEYDSRQSLIWFGLCDDWFLLLFLVLFCFLGAWRLHSRWCWCEDQIDCFKRWVSHLHFFLFSFFLHLFVYLIRDNCLASVCVSCHLLAGNKCFHWLC